MRWLMIDRFEAFEKGVRATAVKVVSRSEEHVHDVCPADPRLPPSLMIEGMAQTAGILVGHADGFKQKVILAKIGKAAFTDALAVPGTTLRHTATVDRLDEGGASTTGTVELLHPDGRGPERLADVELMFSHVDRNRQGLTFPEGNFVFTGQLHDLLVRSGVSVPPEAT